MGGGGEREKEKGRGGKGREQGGVEVEIPWILLSSHPPRSPIGQTCPESKGDWEM